MVLFRGPKGHRSVPRAQRAFAGACQPTDGKDSHEEEGHVKTDHTNLMITTGAPSHRALPKGPPPRPFTRHVKADHANLVITVAGTSLRALPKGPSAPRLHTPRGGRPVEPVGPVEEQTCQPETTEREVLGVENPRQRIPLPRFLAEPEETPTLRLARCITTGSRIRSGKLLENSWDILFEIFGE